MERVTRNEAAGEPDDLVPTLHLRWKKVALGTPDADRGVAFICPSPDPHTLKHLVLFKLQQWWHKEPPIEELTKIIFGISSFDEQGEWRDVEIDETPDIGSSFHVKHREDDLA